MSIYLVNERKQLIRTQSSVIYERETGAGTLQFVIPTAIDGIDLAACACTLHTINMDCAGNVHALDYINNEDFPEHLFCSYTLRTEDTYKDGDVDIWLEFANAEQEVILKTAETKYTVVDHQIAADYLPDGQLDLLEEYLLKFSGIKTDVEGSAAQAKADAERTTLLAANAADSEANAAKSASEASDSAVRAASCVDLADDAARAASTSAQNAAQSADAAAQSATKIAEAEKFAQQAEQSSSKAGQYAADAAASMIEAQNGASVAERESANAAQSAKDAAQSMASAETYAKGTASDRYTTARLVDAAAVSARDAAGYAEQSAASAQQASKSAQDAANAIGGLTVDVKDGETASAVVSDVDGHKHIDFILPGAGGAKVEIDNKTITRDADGRLQTAVGGYINEGALNITWDGNTDGLVSVNLGDSGVVYKVSDLTPTVDELIGAMASSSSGETMIVSGDDIMADSDYAVLRGYVPLVVTYKDDVLIQGLTFPEKGTYFRKGEFDSEVVFTSSLTASNAVVQIDERFIPKTAAVLGLEESVLGLEESVQNLESGMNYTQITANNANIFAQNAQQTANNAKTAAQNAQQTANEASTAAQNAQTTANEASTAAQNAQQTAANAQTTADKIRPDWNVMDTASRSYIANRPCYDTNMKQQSRRPLPLLSIHTTIGAGADSQEVWMNNDSYTQNNSPFISAGAMYSIGDMEDVYVCEEIQVIRNTIYHYPKVIGNKSLLLKNKTEVLTKTFGNDAAFVDESQLSDTGEDFVYMVNDRSATSRVWYIVKDGAQGKYNVKYLYTVTRHIKQLDESMIPSTIQRVGGDIILASSTANSTKKFKITIDDNGQLSATEVV